MKLMILGATGGTGLEIVLQAIERGHQVTAFVRNPERLKMFGEGITIVRGDLLSSAQLEQVIQGQEAVLSAFGPRYPVSKSEADLLQRFARALTNAMSHIGVKRVVIESVAFLFKDSLIPPAYLVGRLFF
jgi:putative NADH-flavin reductase